MMSFYINTFYNFKIVISLNISEDIGVSGASDKKKGYLQELETLWYILNINELSERRRGFGTL